MNFDYFQVKLVGTSSVYDIDSLLYGLLFPDSFVSFYLIIDTLEYSKGYFTLSLAMILWPTLLHEGIAHNCINAHCNKGAIFVYYLIIYQDNDFPHNIYRMEVQEGELQSIGVLQSNLHK